MVYIVVYSPLNTIAQPSQGQGQGSLIQSYKEDEYTQWNVPGSSQFFVHAEKRGTLVKFITCVM